ncbi:MAG TPA: hypothetical protein VEW03_14120, partial [Longimicrobiaceae bacterium]|nr:hypothetical protein [Longimicrobiaceae bacterium]
MPESALRSVLVEPPAPAAGEELRAEVQELVRALAKALRTHLLYEGASPALDRFLESLKERLQGLWGRMPRVTLTVEEKELTWEGASVYAAPERENLAFLLHRDGLREITMHRGFEREELEVFLGLLAQVQRARGEDKDDLLTLFWDRDWLHFRYRYVESLPEGTELPGSAGEAPAQVQVRQEEPEAAAAVSPEDFR